MIKRYPKIMIAYRCMKDAWDLYEPPKETSMGFKLAGNRSMQNGTHEVQETEIVKAILPNVDIVINVGANVGYYSCIAMNQGKYVIAFEPLYNNLQYLYRNIKANKWGNKIEIIPQALSDRVGIVEIFGSGTGASLIKGWADLPKQFSTFVSSSTMDIALGSRFQGNQCLIIIDIEGAEHLMLQGATNFLRMQPKPVWMVEISISEQQPEGFDINPNLASTFSMFWENGYNSWTADGKYLKITLPMIEEIVNTGKNPLKTHNFLFASDESNLEHFGMHLS